MNIDRQRRFGLALFTGALIRELEQLDHSPMITNAMIRTYIVDWAQDLARASASIMPIEAERLALEILAPLLRNRADNDQGLGLAIQ